MLNRVRIALLGALMVSVPAAAAFAAQGDPAATSASPSPAAVSGSPRAAAQPALPPYDVFANVLSEPQRKMLDRDSRCHDARSATDAFVSSDGSALQTGVDAMIALEKCATLPRVGGDWADFRDYVITAAAALAYKVGASASDERLLRRAVEDASHVSGYQASNATVSAYSLSENVNPDVYNGGHSMGAGPAQSSERAVKNTKLVSAYSGPFGKLATAIAGASNTQLATIATSHAQQH